MRRATGSNILNIFNIERFQSTLSMRRATDGLNGNIWLHRISIHALHEESDSNTRPAAAVVGFQSTLSMRRATKAIGQA